MFLNQGKQNVMSESRKTKCDVWIKENKTWCM